MIKSATLISWFPFRQGKTKIKIYGKTQESQKLAVSPSAVHTAGRKLRAESVFKQLIHSENVKATAAFALSAGIILLFVTYLFSVNSNVAKSYKVSEVQKQIASLTDEYKRNLLKSSEATAIGTMQDNFAAEHFVPVTGVQYVQATSGSLGLR